MMEEHNSNMTTLIGLVKELAETVNRNTRIIQGQTKLIGQQEDTIREQSKRIARNEKQIFLLIEKCKVLHSKIDRKLEVE